MSLNNRNTNQAKNKFSISVKWLPDDVAARKCTPQCDGCEWYTIDFLALRRTLCADLQHENHVAVSEYYNEKRLVHITTTTKRKGTVL